MKVGARSAIGVCLHSQEALKAKVVKILGNVPLKSTQAGERCGERGKEGGGRKGEGEEEREREGKRDCRKMQERMRREKRVGARPQFAAWLAPCTVVSGRWERQSSQGHLKLSKEQTDKKSGSEDCE